MNPPNLLSLLRIVLLPFILLSLKNGWDGLLLALMLAAAATDFFDGLLARRLGMVTELGRILDPVADKVCLNSMAVALALWRDFPWWATGLIVGRDALILMGALVWMRRAGAVPVSNWPGKAAVTFLAGAIVCYAMRWQPWGRFILLAGILLAAVSGAFYLAGLIKRMRAA